MSNATNPERRPTARAFVEDVLQHWARPRELDDKFTAALEARDLEASQALERARQEARQARFDAGLKLGEFMQALEAAEGVLFEALSTGPELIYNWWLANEAEIRRVHARIKAALASTPTDPGSADAPHKNRTG